MIKSIVKKFYNIINIMVNKWKLRNISKGKNIFMQDKESAYRRNRYYWGKRYERKQKIGNAFYKQCRKLIPIRDFIRRKITIKS